MYKELFMQMLGDPELAASTAATVISEYKPHIYKLLKEFFEVYKDYINNDEVYEYSAKSKMSYYQALINAGFTEEQAFTLLLDRELRNERAMMEIAETSKAKVTIND